MFFVRNYRVVQDGPVVIGFEPATGPHAYVALAHASDYDLLAALRGDSDDGSCVVLVADGPSKVGADGRHYHHGVGLMADGEPADVAMEFLRRHPTPETCQKPWARGAHELCDWALEEQRCYAAE